MRFNNSGRLTAIVLLLSLVIGCTGSQVRRAEPIQVELPELKQKEFSIDVQLNYQLAISQLHAGETERAEQAFQALLTQQPDIAGAWYNLGLIQYHQQRKDEALRSLDRCLAINPRHPAAYTVSGLILRQRGQFEQARLAYAKALESDPDYADAHLNLAILYDIYLQYREDAKSHYQRYLQLVSDEKQTEQVKLWLQDLQLQLDQGGNG
jgi:tetratricopeptide (TPR) repeat protein